MFVVAKIDNDRELVQSQSNLPLSSVCDQVKALIKTLIKEKKILLDISYT